MPKMISCEDFERIDDFSVKQNIIFDYVKDIYEIQTKKDEFCDKRAEGCGNRFKSLENRKKFDTTLSGFMGIVGGALAWFGTKIFGK